MNAAKRKALEAAGWTFGDAADFLKMNAAERQMLNARVELALAIRRQRSLGRLTQKALGARLKTSQPRVALIERAAPSVSLDQMVRAFTAAGGEVVVTSTARAPRRASASRSTRGRAIKLEIAVTD